MKAWFLLLLLSIFLITMGIQGSLGRVVAVIFVPSILTPVGDING